jgi:nucleotide-binding universal stress UspA family protein
MAAKAILFPTDFSTASDAALAHAETLAKQSGARLVIVHVEEPPLAYGGGELYYGLPEPNSERIQKMLEDVRPRDPAVPFEHRLSMGDPAGEVVRIAGDEGCEMIVMGTHGRTGLTRLLMGSVAEQIVRRAPCDRTIGLLCGKGKSPHSQLPDHVVFARFNLEWLEQP